MSVVARDLLLLDASLHRVGDLNHLAGRLTALLFEKGVPEEISFPIQISIVELVNNAIEHGHGFDPAKKAHLKLVEQGDAYVLSVCDQGRGFDPTRVADPADPTRLKEMLDGDDPKLERGRGIWLVRKFARSLEFREGGRLAVATFEKNPSVTDAERLARGDADG